MSIKNNSGWGIEGYKVPADYIDTRKLKEISSNTVKRPAPRALNKPDYLTDTFKATKGMPAPNKYDIVKPWFDKDKKQAAKYVTKKNSYIDDIIHENKTRPTPGPGAHEVLKPIQEMKKKGGELKTKGSEKVNFLCEMEYVSNTIPGPGNYNPRQIQTAAKKNHMNPEDWKKKHVEDSKRAKTAANPDKDSKEKTMIPLPVAFDTFAKTYEIGKDKSKSTKVKQWGTSARFQLKKDTKKDPNNFPGPGMYNTVATWNGKEAAKADKKDKNWMNKLTKGITKSIYYS